MDACCCIRIQCSSILFNHDMAGHRQQADAHHNHRHLVQALADLLLFVL